MRYMLAGAATWGALIVAMATVAGLHDLAVVVLGAVTAGAGILAGLELAVQHSYQRHQERMGLPAWQRDAIDTRAQESKF